MSTSSTTPKYPIKISDPSMGPYHIIKDNYCFTLYKTMEATKYSTTNKSYDMARGHFSDIGGCIKQMIMDKIDDNSNGEYTLKEYLSEFKKVKEEIEQILSIVR